MLIYYKLEERVIILSGPFRSPGSVPETKVCFLYFELLSAQVRVRVCRSVPFIKHDTIASSKARVRQWSSATVSCLSTRMRVKSIPETEIWDRTMILSFTMRQWTYLVQCSRLTLVAMHTSLNVTHRCNDNFSLVIVRFTSLDSIPMFWDTENDTFEILGRTHKHHKHVLDRTLISSFHSSYYVITQSIRRHRNEIRYGRIFQRIIGHINDKSAVYIFRSKEFISLVAKMTLERSLMFLRKYFH